MREDAVFAAQRRRVSERLGEAMLAAVGLMVRQYMGAPTEEYEGQDSAAAAWEDDGEVVESAEVNGSFDMERYLALGGAQETQARGDRTAPEETARSGQTEKTRAETQAREETRFVQSGAAWRKTAGAEAEGDGELLRTAREVSGAVERDARRYDGGFYLY